MVTKQSENGEHDAPDHDEKTGEQLFTVTVRSRLAVEARRAVEALERIANALERFANTDD